MYLLILDNFKLLIAEQRWKSIQIKEELLVSVIPPSLDLETTGMAKLFRNQLLAYIANRNERNYTI